MYTRGIMDDLASVFVTILTAVSVERPYLMVQQPIFGEHHARIYQRQFLGVKKKNIMTYPVLGDAASCIDKLYNGERNPHQILSTRFDSPLLLVHLRRPKGPSSTSIATSPILPYPELTLYSSQSLIYLSVRKQCRLRPSYRDRAPVFLMPLNCPNPPN